jgi:hypothetical protein
MIFVLVYLVVSLTIYVKLFQFIQRQSKGLKTESTHLEMREVKAGESLLTMKYHGSLRALRPEQHPDLGFSEFLANRDSGNRDHDDS